MNPASTMGHDSDVVIGTVIIIISSHLSTVILHDLNSSVDIGCVVETQHFGRFVLRVPLLVLCARTLEV